MAFALIEGHPQSGSDGGKAGHPSWNQFQTRLNPSETRHLKEAKNWMNYQAFAEWMTSLSLSGRIAALALIYSSLTVGTRQLFLPEVKGKELVVLDMLLGINEIHHTLSNQLVAYATADKEAFSIEGFGRVLAEITQKYRIEGFLEAAVEFARSRISPDG